MQSMAASVFYHENENETIKSTCGIRKVGNNTG